MNDSTGTRMLHEQLDRWTSAGIIDAGQASRIEAAEQARAVAHPRRRLPLVAEVLGYLGAVLAAAAIAVALRQVWRHVPPAAWLAFSGALAVGFLVAGALVRAQAEPAFARLRSVLWLLATASAAAFAAVLTSKFLHMSDNGVALSAAAAWLVCAIPLWWRTRSAVQQAATFGGAIALTATALDPIDPHAGPFAYGLAVWVIAVAWGAAVARGYLVPRVTGVMLSGAGALVGATIAMSADTPLGQVLALATVAGLLAAGILAHRVLLIAIGAAGTLYVIPEVANRYLPGSLAAPLAVATVGLVLLAIAMWLAGQRKSAAG
ncbi:MAG TPA: DUF2157 domain-containing protein [Streptosporangiaceae bacterium]|nr:DUF2157 domain-containing protein [Streptosporangiaceae bacterium]